MTIHEQITIKDEKRKRRFKIDILKDIKDFIETDEKRLVFNKSAMLDEPWNLDPRTVEEFMEIVYFCQEKIPRIQIIRKRGKIFYQILDYQRLKQEMKELKLNQTDKAVSSPDLLNPKVYPVFKCVTCGFEIGYPSHHNEHMKYFKSAGKVQCYYTKCGFIQRIPEHHNKKMEVYIKHTTGQGSDDWLHETIDE